MNRINKPLLFHWNCFLYIINYSGEITLG